ncbi:GntR family transcriptional regulator [Enterovirga aerilata]|uniref:GntR family transcriptional regulator n=1 Tax=Enterovirga aerilata TaxID=2730920 RepID=A0A849IAP6_9HYPH|nr:GntR family transcriptional regulator [Enterovirga sp. DB1703]NNM73130.1 GntR family transcriptional regulator [Enterovirga sp. DB1703]
MVAALAQVGRIERVTLGDRVYDELRELIIGGELAPGDKLSLRSVADTLGVSIMPVREAVSRLVADEALEVLPNRAVCVPAMTREKFRELTRIRLVVEGFAAEQAALNRKEADLRVMAAFDATFRREARSGAPDPKRAVRANKDLHFAIYRASRMPSLVAIVEGLWLKIGPVLNLDLKLSPERLANGGAEIQHARAVAAIAGGDAAGARAALAADIEGAAAFIEATGRLA